MTLCSVSSVILSFYNILVEISGVLILAYVSSHFLVKRCFNVGPVIST